jgi:hypothetical protein
LEHERSLKSRIRAPTATFLGDKMRRHHAVGLAIVEGRTVRKLHRDLEPLLNADVIDCLLASEVVVARLELSGLLRNVDGYTSVVIFTTIETRI